jgi:hypothetical protein
LLLSLGGREDPKVTSSGNLLTRDYACLLRVCGLSRWGLKCKSPEAEREALRRERRLERLELSGEL